MSSRSELLRWLPLRANELMLLAAIAVVVVGANALDSNHSYFEKPGASAHEIARYASLLGIYALGATVVIISGGIDLSVGSMIAFSATVCGSILLLLAPDEMTSKIKWYRLDDAAMERLEKMKSLESLVGRLRPLVDQTFTKRSDFEEKLAATLNKTEFEASGEQLTSLAEFTKPIDTWVIIVAIAGSLASGAFVGTMHAWLITSIRLPPFIATLATLVGLRSLARIVCDGVTSPLKLVRTQINISDPFFKYLNDNIKVQVTIFVVLALVTWFILSRTVLGRHIYALGGNEQAARLSGIRAENIKWFAYVFAGVTGSIAGVLFLGNELVAAPVNQGRGYELNAIAAAVVGGCSLQGGLGTVMGTVLGCVFLRVVIDAVARIIKSGADMYEGLIVGAVVVAAVTFSQLQQLWTRGQELFPGKLGACAVVAISAILWMFAAASFGLGIGSAIAGGSLLVLGTVKAAEVLRARRA